MKKNIKRILILSLTLNVILTLIKLVFGYLFQTSSLISDGYNSFSDVFVSIILLVFTKVSLKEPDKNHPYGHEKFEAIVYLVLGLILVFTSLFIAFYAIIDLIDYYNQPDTHLIPNFYSIYVAIVALTLKIILFMIVHFGAKRYKSYSLKADSINHLFDILSTSIALISIILSQFGLLYLEYIASIIIAFIILKTAISMLKDAIPFLVDQAPSGDVIKTIKKTVLAVDGVINIDDIKVRMHMTKLYVDIEIACLAHLTLKEAHTISEKVHDAVEHNHKVIHCMVHVNPYKIK